MEFHTNMLIIIFARLFFNKVKIFNRIKGKIPFRCGGPYNNLVLTNNENDQIQFEPNEFHFHSAVFLENPVPLSHNLGVIKAAHSCSVRFLNPKVFTHPKVPVRRKV